MMFVLHSITDTLDALMAAIAEQPVDGHIGITGQPKLQSSNWTAFPPRLWIIIWPNKILVSEAKYAFTSHMAPAALHNGYWVP